MTPVDADFAAAPASVSQPSDSRASASPASMIAGSTRTRPAKRGGARRRAMGGAHWPLVVALLVFFAVGVSALGGILSGSEWGVSMVGMAAVVLGAGGLLRARWLSARLTTLAEVGVLLLLLTLFFGGGSGLVWLIPTPTTFEHFGALVREGISSITMQNVPAQADDGILFLLVVGAGLLVIVMDGCAITARAPALAGLPMLIPLAVPGLLVDGGASMVTLILAALAYLALLTVDRRVRGQVDRWLLGSSLVVGGVGIVAALVMSIAIPPLSTTALVGNGSGGLLFGSGISPLVDIGKDLRRPDASPVLHYTTTATTLPYFKLLTLDRFVGTTWSSGSAPGRTELAVDQLTRPPGLGADVETTESKTAVVIDGVATTWLPAPAPAVEVDGLRGRWFWNDKAEVITSSNSTTRGQDYTVTALQLEPTAEQLRAAGTNYPEEILSSLEVPSPRPAIIDETAQSVTAGTTTPYDAALALQDYLRGSLFSYDTKAPVVSGSEGGGVQVIGAFLESKTGYCVHFASAMAIMARTLGIPARVSVGYLPGARASTGDAEKNTYTVDSHDLHAWPELYFVGIGWVPFEPTPSRGTVPDYAKPDAAPQAGSTQSPAEPAPAPRPSDTPQRSQSTAAPSELAAAQTTSSVVTLGGAVLVGLVVFLLPMILRQRRRIRRFTQIRSGQAQGGEAWLELADTARDHGIGVYSTRTPREFAARLSALPGMGGTEAEASLDRLLVAEERDRYDRPSDSDARKMGEKRERDLRIVIDVVHSGASRRARVLATLLPVSLVRRNRSAAPSDPRKLPSSKA